METNEKNIIKDPKLSFLILQITAALIIIAFALGSKAVGGKFFIEIREWYIKNYCEETTIDLVMTSAAKLTDSNSILAPLHGVVTSRFGERTHPISGQSVYHRGIDIDGEMGKDIVCPMNGQVVDCGYSKSYGNYIEVKHGEHITTLYAHCESIDAKVGDTVKKGQTVAYVGDSGDSTGPHLHFEICIDGKPINPQWIIKEYEV